MRGPVLKLITGIVFLMLALGATVASAQDDEDTWYGQGPMMGSGMMGGGFGDWGMMPSGGCQGYGPGMMQGYGAMGMAGERGYGNGGMRGRWMASRGMAGQWGMGQGMMRGMGMMHLLNLTDEQQEKIRHIMDAERKDHWKEMGGMMDARNRLRDLYAGDQPDPKKVGEAWGDIARIRQRMIEANVRAHNRIWNLLTKEQQEQWHQWRHGHWGKGLRGQGGMGPGRMSR